MEVVITPDSKSLYEENSELLGWPSKKILEEVTRQLGGKITYLSTLNSLGISSNKIVIEYDVKEKE